MNAQHAPGPWYADGCILRASNGITIIGSINEPADLRLAAAAPELLEELQALVQAIQGNFCNRVLANLIKSSQAAIAKAQTQEDQ